MKENISWDAKERDIFKSLKQFTWKSAPKEKILIDLEEHSKHLFFFSFSA